MHFITTIQTNTLFDKLKIYHQLTDEEVINLIFNKNSNKFKSPNTRNWDYAIENLSRLYKKLNNQENIKYIDIGSGSGKKTKLFSKYLKLKKEDTYCTDIKEWGPYQQDNLKYPFQFKYITDEKLDYDDNSFDLATCILSLHHVKNLNKFIKEIYRIIKPNGYLLFIDHSVYDDYDRLFVNIQHLLYTVFYDKKKNYIDNPDYIYCYNKYEWNYIMNKNKFIPKKQDRLEFEIQFEINYDNIFYSFYQKKESF
jgi:SAM-dependent methyltransferase